MDAETKRAIEAEAARRNMTVPRYMRWLRERNSMTTVSPWSEPGEHLPQTLPGAMGTMSLDDMLNQSMKMRMLDMMGVNTSKGLTKEDLVAFGEALAHQLSPAPVGSATGTDRIKAILIEKAEIKQLRDMAGDDEATKRFAEAQQAKLDAELKTLNEKFVTAETQHKEALAAKDAEMRAQQEAQREADRQREMAQLRADMESRTQALIDEIQALRAGGGPSPPVPAAQVITEKLQEMNALVAGVKNLQGEVQKLAPPPSSPPTGQSSVWDKASYLLQQVAEAGSQLMEGAGALVAARTGGVPPSQLGRMPGPGADNTVYVPDYASGPAQAPEGFVPSAAPPPPPTGAPAAGPSTARDEQLFPRNTMYIDPEGNKVVSREEFIAKYGDTIRRDPSLAKQVPVARPSPMMPSDVPNVKGPPVEPNEGRPDSAESETRDLTTQPPSAHHPTSV
ncbi:MAG TPA: hypothetical protein VMG99_08805 [Thermoplasmata archaeon]|nr:hypothetical protein [Thermoplasmata archaeon]